MWFLMALELNPFSAITAGLEKIYTIFAAALPALLFVGGTILVAYIAINIIQRIAKKIFERVDFNPDIEYLAYRAVGWVAWFFVLVWLVGQLGQEEIFATLIAGGTLAGLAIALAVKDSLADAVGGVLLLQDKHFDLGDRVKTAGVEGKILEVGLRKTRLQLDDGSIQIVANAKIDKGGWTLKPRTKKRERLFTKLSKRAKGFAPVKRKQ